MIAKAKHEALPVPQPAPAEVERLALVMVNATCEVLNRPDYSELRFVPIIDRRVYLRAARAALYAYDADPLDAR